MESSSPPPRFTIFTPTWNAEAFLHRVRESIDALPRRDYEWILVDDASTDGTAALIDRYAAELGERVRVVKKAQNRGLLDSWATVVDMARGDFLVGAAHDDRFAPETLDVVESAWEGIPPERRAGFSGVTVLCRSADGEVAQAFPRDRMESNAIEMYFRHRYHRESWPIVRVDVLRRFPFPRDRRNGESVLVWYPMAERYQALYRNVPLRTYYHDNPRSISNSRDFSLYAADLAFHNREMLRFGLRYPLRGWWDAYLSAARYLRFSRHAGRELGAAIADLPAAPRALAILAAPAAAALLAVDRLRAR